MTTYLDLAPGTRVRLLETALPVELEADTGRIVRSVDGWTGHYIVRLDRPARYAAGGHVDYLDHLRADHDHLAVLEVAA
jgi:hypothetical protein